MGEVYRATDTNLKRQVAIKVLPEALAADAERLARFQREAEVLATLNHPNIAAIYGLERASGQSALVMELVEGPTLADRIAEGAIPFDEALPIARQIAEALEAAHEQGIVHRDLKPANVKLRADGTVKVLDFGLAKAIEPAGAMSASQSMSPTITTPAMTQAGMILGTAAYMSPEQARGKPVDRRADIWAFGAVLYEMLTGQRAFEDEDISLTLSKVLREDPAFDAVPADVPASVTQALRVCLRKDPRQRASDIHDVRLALEGAFSPPQQVGEPPQAVTPSARGLPAMAAVALILLAAVLAGAAAWIARPAPTRFGSEVIRLAVPLSPDARFADESTGRWPPLALAPDGTRLAYVSGGRLFVRDLGRFDAQEVAGSEGATNPFFSPDGLWVGFFADGQLKKASVAGGAAEPLADAPRAAGGSWASDGWIYFAASNATGLSRVHEDGGGVEAVTTLDRAAGQVTHRFPQVLSGDGAVLYSVWTGPGWDEQEVHVHVPSSGEDRLLLSRAGSGRYVTSGHLVYERAGELAAVPFDLERLVVTGPSVPLGLEVAQSEGGFFAVSDAGALAYVPRGQADERRLVWVDRDGSVEPLPVEARRYMSVTVSPDGNTAALTTQGGTWNIWLLDLVRPAAPQQVQAGPGSSQFPVFSSDGASLFYRGTRTGFRNVYRTRVDGSGTEERLTRSEGSDTPYAVSRDGRWLAFGNVSPSTGEDIWMLPLEDGGEPQPYLSTVANENNPGFSPDGRWLAYGSTSPPGGIYVKAFEEPGGGTLVAPGGLSPLWSPDGREIFYLDGQSDLMVVPVATQPRLSAGTPRQVARGPFDGGGITPDGERLLMIEGNKIEAGQTQVNVVINWVEELKRLVPVD